MTINIFYKNLCPVCKGYLTSEEIENDICKTRNIRISNTFLPSGYEQFQKYFEERTGYKINSIQSFWCKKLLKGFSFAGVAPTGIGKTLFGSTFSCFLAEKYKKKVYIIVPTTLILKQVYEKIIQISRNIRILVYLQGMRKNEKEEFFSRLSENNFDILLTTSAFLSKHFEKISHITFDFIFVDDVDAILKASKNVERVLRLLGFEEDEIKKLEVKKNKKHGQLMVSTATAKVGKKANLFVKLLNFSVGSSRHTIRNIEEYALPISSSEKIEAVKHIVKKMGSGGLLFTNTEKEAKELEKELNERGIFCSAIVSSTSKKEIEKKIESFLKGELYLLIGVSSHYGLLVRGIDYPYHIRYAIFFSTPVFKITLKELEEASTKMILALSAVFRKDERLEKLIPYILKSKIHTEKAREILKEIFKNKEFEKAGEDVFVGDDYILIPDIASYIQASGRTCRLYAGGITKGFSIVLDENAILKTFLVRASFYDINIRICNTLEEIPFDKIKKEIKESREKYQKAISGEDIIKPALFVVESPTKARQIARFFGKPAVILKNGQIFYEVATGNYILVITASLGHVVDLVEKDNFHGVVIEEKEFIPIYGSIKKCKSDNIQWVDSEACPRCGNAPEYSSDERIYNIIEMAALTENVIIATDPDTEGEKIAWDIANFTKSVAKVKRAEFHEITKNAVLHALSNLRDIDEKMVKAQIVRRIEDRWIGFELSHLLQEKFKEKNLSAGRAQTPVLGWIIERYKEHKEKIKFYSLKIGNIFIHLGNENEIKLDVKKPFTKLKVKISRIESKEVERTPQPPYSTDTALKDINRILKIPSQKAMKILQDLFENGLITYHRTDSVRVSEKGLQIGKSYLKEDFVGRKWELGNKGAHECIRPTRPFDSKTIRGLIYQKIITVSKPITQEHLKVYDLIFRRFMASQAKSIKIKEIVYEIQINENKIMVKRNISAKGVAYRLYPFFIKIERPLPEGEFYGIISYSLRSKVELYTQADVISLMKEKKIGRPSTYATILNKLFLRNYIFEKNLKLFPTKKGIIIERFLKENFAPLVSEERTRIVEKIMDDIANGKKGYYEALKEFYEEIINFISKYGK